jgi:hypothetical protein
VFKYWFLCISKTSLWLAAKIILLQTLVLNLSRSRCVCFNPPALAKVCFFMVEQPDNLFVVVVDRKERLCVQLSSLELSQWRRIIKGRNRFFCCRKTLSLLL